MMIYLNGQEITSLVLGAEANGEWAIEPQILPVRPEQYLATLADWLAENKLALRDIEGFVLVQGPGSATSLRASHALVNTLAFAFAVPIISIEKDPGLSDATLITSFVGQVARPVASPKYAHTPNVTASNRDALRRKQV